MVTVEREKYQPHTPLALAMGNFDGVHLGHKKLFEAVLKISKANHLIPAAYTFFPHPARIIAPFGSPPLIQTLEQRLKEIERLGIKEIIIEKFNRKTATINHENYFHKILLPLGAKCIVVGYDFTFGRDRKGNVDFLKHACAKAGLTIEIIPAQFHNGTLISSTIIRQLIAACEITEANKLLGRPYEATGTVVPGHGRGASLGFPTANINAENELLPGPGVYITTTAINDSPHTPSVTFTGSSPTFGRRDFLIETYILNKKIENLTGKTAAVRFLKFVRPAMAFQTREELAAQITKDVEEARKYHGCC